MTARHHLKHFFIGLFVVLTGVATAATFNLFSPATGILKGSASTYVTTAAVSSDVIATFSGTCNNGTYLRGDGTCNTPPGTGVSSVGLSMPSGFTVTNSPVTSSGTLAVTTTLNGVLHGNGSAFSASNVLLGSEVTGTLPVGNGGTGATSLTGVLTGNGSSPFSAATSANVISLWSGTCNSGSFLRGDGACVAAGAGTVTSVGLTMPGVFSVANSPVTTSGTIAVTALGTSGGVPYFNSGTTMASSAALAASQLVLGGGAGNAPATLGSLGSTTTVLHGNAAGTPTFGAVGLTADVTGTLAVGNGGTGVTSSTGSGSNVLSASPTLTGTVTAATIAATAVTVGGNNVCQSTGTNCPASSGATAVTGTFTTTWDDACTTSPTTTWGYIAVSQGAGLMVTLVPTSTSGFPCTSDSTTFSESGTSVPVGIRPTNTRNVSAIMAGGLDSSTNVFVTYGITSTGNLNITKYAAGAASQSPWTSSGSKQAGGSISPAPFTYYTAN